MNIKIKESKDVKLEEFIVLYRFQQQVIQMAKNAITGSFADKSRKIELLNGLNQYIIDA